MPHPHHTKAQHPHRVTPIPFPIIMVKNLNDPKCVYFWTNHRHFHTKYFFDSLDFYFHPVCVCVKLPETCPDTWLKKCPKCPNRAISWPASGGTGHPVTRQSPKTSQRTLVYYPEKSKKWIFIDKRGLN